MASTHSYLKEIEKLSHEKSSDKRREVLRSVTDLFFFTENRQNDADIKVFGTIMDQLAYELEVEARQELSERLATARRGPRQLIVRLANDEIDVARPVLEKSVTLTDEDLVQIASVHGQDHLYAISGREKLAIPVTDIVLQRGDEKIVYRMVTNKGAMFSTQGFDILATRSDENSAIGKALVARDDTPKDIIEKVKQKVTEKLKAEFAGSDSGIMATEIETIVGAKANEFSHKPKEVTAACEHMGILQKTGQLSEDIIVQYARARSIDECIHALSLKTGFPPAMIKHCLLEADLAALAILCKASDFSQKTFIALLQLRLHLHGLPSNLALKELKRFQEMTSDSAQRVLRFLKARIVASDTKKYATPMSGAAT